MDPPDQIDSITGSATNEVAGDDSSLKQQDLVLSEVVKARERQIREKIGDFSSKIDSKLTDTNGLRVGVLQFGDDRNKLGKFVYVPMNFDFTNYDGMKSILDALEIDEPDLVFNLSRNHGIVPPLNGKKSLEDWIDEEDAMNEEGFTPFRVPDVPQNGSSASSSSTGQVNGSEAMPSLLEAASTLNTTAITTLPETIHTENGFTGALTLASPRLNAAIEEDERFRNLRGDAETSYFESTRNAGPGKNGKRKIHSKLMDISAFANPSDAFDSAHIRMIEGNVTNLFTAISEFKNTLFLITKPFRGNTLSEIACAAAAESRQKTITLGLFHTDNSHPGGNFTVIKDTRGATSEYEVKQVEEARRRSESGQRNAWDDRLDHSDERFRMPVPGSIFELDCVANGEVPQKAIRVDCNFTDYEREVYEMNNHCQHIPGGLANECSHRLVFASSEQKKAFRKAFTQFFATGYFACGATDSEMKTAEMALKKGQPLFVIEGTGAVATVTKKFIEKKEKMFSNRYKENMMGNSFSSRNLQSGLDADCILQVERFLSKAALAEGSTLLEANIGMFNNFNADAQFVIANRSGNEPQGRRQDISYIQEVKNEITKVMATAFHHNNEIGGQEKDRIAIDLCDDLIEDIKKAKRRYHFQAVFIQVLVRLIIIFITTTTVLTVFCMGQDDDINFVNEEGQPDIVPTFNIQGKEFCRGPLLVSLDLVGLILPIIAAALQALDKAFRPDAKFANLLLTQHQLTSEKFLFRARIRLYSSIGQTRGGSFENARKTFMNRCNTLYSECVKTEVKEGTLNPNLFSGASCGSWLVGWTKPILRDIGAFLRCKPLNEVEEATQRKLFVPSNWFVKCFKSKKGYQEWQGREMREMLKAYREGEADIGRDEEEQRLRVVKESVAIFNLTEEDGDTLTNIYALEKQTAQKEKYCIISIDEYVKLRLIPMREKFKRSLPIYIFWRNICQVLLIAFTAMSTFFVSMDMEHYVPIALAAAAASDAFLSYFHLESRTPVLHGSESELRQILLDIQGLDILEKRLTSTTCHFIERAEAVILSNYAFLSETTLKFGQKKNEERSEQELEEEYNTAAEKYKKNA